jgi:hypothetical protein
MTFDVVSFNVVVLIDVPFAMLFECIILEPIVLVRTLRYKKKEPMSWINISRIHE